MEIMLVKEYARRRGIGKRYINRMCQNNTIDKLPGVHSLVKMPGHTPKQDYYVLTVNVSELPPIDTLK